VTVRAGWRREQIAAALDNLPVGFSGADFLAVTAAGASVPDHWFLRSRPPGASLEGFLFPGEYVIAPGTTAAAFRDALLAAFAANSAPEMEAAAAARGLNLWQAVNLASIIQREAYNANEQTMVAGVFHNRLARGNGLGASVTLQYAFGVPGDWWPRATRLNFNSDSPYNTNRFRGLPPTPISNPGTSALRAALYPAAHDYLYFSGKCGGGGNFYARTFEEFRAGLACP
jgi:UPF0755 protein